MSKLNIATISILSANLGELNPLPDLKRDADFHASIPYDKNTVSQEEAKYMGWGRVNGILPYMLQDGYDRNKRPKKWKAVILENEYLKAVFLPEIGGRLWLLEDKKKNKNLLHRNPVFQPCNLALRNAWVSGGVEWNIGIIGHTPFTVDNVFAETLYLSDGTPVLRMYQYERVRKLVYRVEAILPEKSKFLYVRVRIDNAGNKDTAVYWWSNMAVNEREDVRVIVPANLAYRWSFGEELSKISIPYMPIAEHKSSECNKMYWDISRTTQIKQSMDFFFDLPDGQRRWISAVDRDGYGLVQVSTDTLVGRKLFVWGTGDGGRNWQRFLSEPGQAYIELQAGLAHTQLEHLPMRAGQIFDWMEAYGPIEADSAAVHGENWNKAVYALENALDKACPREQVEGMLQTAQSELDNKHGKIVHSADGWAAVQKMLDKSFNDAGLVFSDENIGERERPWAELVKDGRLPCPSPLSKPLSYQIGSEWEKLLNESIKNKKSDHWYGYYLLGVMQLYRNETALGRENLEKSIKSAKNPWALRCLAVLDQWEEKYDAAADKLKQAVDMLPERHLAIEAMQAFNNAGRYNESIALYKSLDNCKRALGRIKMLYIEVLIKTGSYDLAEKMLLSPIQFTDMREGEVKLTDLWFELFALKIAGGNPVTEELISQVKRDYPPPKHLDFRMR